LLAPLATRAGGPYLTLGSNRAIWATRPLRAGRAYWAGRAGRPLRTLRTRWTLDRTISPRLEAHDLRSGVVALHTRGAHDLDLGTLGHAAD
jgi:hypothetical protein